MAVLCKLADPAGYRAFDWDMLSNPADFAYWLGLFATFPKNIRKHLQDDGLTGDDFESRWSAFLAEYKARFDAIRSNPHADGPISTISLGTTRQEILDKHGWPDPYVGVKRRENESASKLYPSVIRQIDAKPTETRWETLLRSLFAGNMFDLGAPKTIEMYNSGQVDFASILDRIPDRPWFIDDADALIDRLDAGCYRQVLFFVDNTGADVVLGAVPFARAMARNGIRVVMAANSDPALNDITFNELNPLLQRLSAVDPVLADLLTSDRITTVATGTGSPLIDLSTISDASNAAAADSQLIILEGMGRGIESNWRQRFTCDVCRMALVKDECVARWLGCDLFQPVCRFDPAE